MPTRVWCLYVCVCVCDRLAWVYACGVCMFVCVTPMVCVCMPVVCVMFVCMSVCVGEHEDWSVGMHEVSVCLSDFGIHAHVCGTHRTETPQPQPSFSHEISAACVLVENEHIYVKHQTQTVPPFSQDSHFVPIANKFDNC